MDASETERAPAMEQAPEAQRVSGALQVPRAERTAESHASKRRGWFQPLTGFSPATSDGAPADKPAAEKARSSRFGTAPAARPDVLTDAETVILPKLEGRSGKEPKGSAGSRGAVQQAAARAGQPQAADAAVAGAAASALAEPATQSLQAAMAPAKVVAPPPRQYEREPVYRSAGRYTPTRRRTWVSRTILLGILCLQAIMSLRLRNTAFEDEALYLYSGHMELEHLLHGAPLYGNFASYFSGSPVLYPVAAAALNQVGGLALARALSLAEMLAVTAMCYSIARRLFNERIALCAAALFSVTESAIFLGNFATYDASCLFLLAAAAWIMVYTARCRWPLFLLAAPLAALAVAVKYAGLLWVPAVAVLPPLTAWPDRIRRAWFYSLGFLVAVGELLYAGLRLGGHSYLQAIETTTTKRAQGATPVHALLVESLRWGGLMFALAVIGSVAYMIKVRTEPDEQIAPAGGRLRRAALGLALTGTALLAPAYQLHLHTDISFQKHIGFGLFFAAPMAGFGLARIMGDHFRWPHFGVAIFSLALVLGLVQSDALYHGWPSSGAFVSALSRYLKPNARYLVEVPEVPIYYLENRPDAQPSQFTGTYPVPPLSTPASFTAAVKDKEFQVIAYNGDVTPAEDSALAKALKASHSYYLASQVYIGYAYGSNPYYYIWVEGAPPKAHKATKPKQVSSARTSGR